MERPPQEIHLDYRPYDHVDAGSRGAADCRLTLGDSTIGKEDFDDNSLLMGLVQAVLFLETGGGQAAEFGWHDTDGDSEWNWRLGLDAYWMHKDAMASTKIIYCYSIKILDRSNRELLNGICKRTDFINEILRAVDPSQKAGQLALSLAEQQTVDELAHLAGRLGRQEAEELARIGPKLSPQAKESRQRQEELAQSKLLKYRKKQSLHNKENN